MTKSDRTRSMVCVNTNQFFLHLFYALACLFHICLLASNEDYITVAVFWRQVYTGVSLITNLVTSTATCKSVSQ